MSSITDYQDDIYNPILEETVKGFIDNASLSSLKDNYKYITIPNGMAYRPDLIAFNYLGDTSLAWEITYINDFYNGIRDYTPGRTIKIPV